MFIVPVKRVRVAKQLEIRVSPFGWSKFEPSALALKRIFWDLIGVAVVKEG